MFDNNNLAPNTEKYHRTSILIGAGIIIVLAALLFASPALRQTFKKIFSERGTETSTDNRRRVEAVDGSFALVVPDTWTVLYPETSKLQGGIIIVESPDLKIEIEPNEKGGTPFVRHKTGAVLTITSLRQTGASPAEPKGEMKNKTQTIVGGLQGTFYEYRPIQTKEGELLEVRLKRGDDLYYFFRFAFNPETFPQGKQTFEEILGSLKIKR